MDVDYAAVSYDISCVENCAPAKEVPGAAIVNLEANFLIPASEQGKDMTFSRLSQTQAMLKRAEKAGSLLDIRTVPRNLGMLAPIGGPTMPKNGGR
jgi:hypothetical protein